MTKQEAIDRTRELLNLLESLLDDSGVDILTANINDPDINLPPLSVCLYKGIEAVAETFGQVPKVSEYAEGEILRHTISCGGYEVFQQKYKIDRDSRAAWEDEDELEEKIEPEYIVSWDGYDGCQRETRFRTREDAELEAADLREHTMFPESVSVTRWPDEPCR